MQLEPWLQRIRVVLVNVLFATRYYPKVLRQGFAPKDLLVEMAIQFVVGLVVPLLLSHWRWKGLPDTIEDLAPMADSELPS